MRIEELPNMVFIVGGPRCGTTTLSSWLNQQPEICFPFVKEPHFFAQYDLTAMSDEAARELTEREFLGEFVRYRARSGGAELIADTAHRAGHSPFNVGDDVRLGLDPAEFRVLQA